MELLLWKRLGRVLYEAETHLILEYPLHSIMDVWHDQNLTIPMLMFRFNDMNIIQVILV